MKLAKVVKVRTELATGEVAEETKYYLDLEWLQADNNVFALHPVDLRKLKELIEKAYGTKEVKVNPDWCHAVADSSKDINPTLYVFKHNDMFWVAPFHEDVCMNSEDDVGPFKPRELLKYIMYTDVSLMMNANGDDVSWMRGWEVTEEILSTLEQTSIR
jgi:hypothetical protein